MTISRLWVEKNLDKIVSLPNQYNNWEKSQIYRKYFRKPIKIILNRLLMSEMLVRFSDKTKWKISEINFNLETILCPLSLSNDRLIWTHRQKKQLKQWNWYVESTCLFDAFYSHFGSCLYDGNKQAVVSLTAVNIFNISRLLNSIKLKWKMLVKVN